MSIHIEPLKLPISYNPEDRIGSINLRCYQAQLRRCDYPRVLLKAPTGSGKTLAYLVRAIETKGTMKFGTVVIVYPTNSLIWDQARSLSELIRKLGKKVNIAIESKNELEWREENSDVDVNLYVLNGETLAAIAEESKSSEGRAFLTHIRKNQAGINIILTNPEILYYLFLHKFHRNEDLLETIFSKKPQNLLILDEFHLYHGYTLATITYMLAYMKALFDQIIFSSATPIDVGELIHQELHTISAEPSNDGDTVKQSMELKLESTPKILGTDEDIQTIKTQVNTFIEKTKNKLEKVKVLVIINSVITCIKLIEALEKDYPNQVTAIHGLVPQSLRPKNSADFKTIVVGTSAIEVGIDFDTASLIFEAHDSATFLQRIGRGARHNSCEATAFIPAIYLPSFMKALPNGVTIDNQRLEQETRRCLPDLPSYSAFPSSPQAAPIMAAILLNWTLRRPAGRRDINDGTAINQTKELLNRGDYHIPEEIKFPKERLLEICEKAPQYGILTMAKKMSCRSSIESIPAIFKDKNNDFQFDYLSLNDLIRVEFCSATAEELKTKGIKIPWQMRYADKFVVVTKIKQNYANVKLNFENKRFFKQPGPLTMFSVIADNHEVEEKIENILKYQPAFRLPRKVDWRLPGFLTTYGDFLIIGGDAYLAWFLESLSLVLEKRPRSNNLIK